MKKNDEFENWKYEQRNVYWKKIHNLFDLVRSRSIPMEIAINNYFIIAYEILNLEKNKDELKEIIISFENLKNDVLIPKQEKSTLFSSELEWDLNAEYDPMYPNDYDKITRGNTLTTFVA